MRTETTSRNIYQFSELSDTAKQYAIEKHAKYERENFDGDYIIDDVKMLAAMFGLDIDKVYYSGFWSQGDGASFTGRYAYKKGALKQIMRECPTDTKLHSIVNQLQSSAFYAATCMLYHRGHYVHENTMHIDNFQLHGEHSYNDDVESTLLEIMRRFAKWIYSRLGSAYEYCSDEQSCIESIEAMEYEFYENGEMV